MKICHLTSVHSRFDIRIFLKECCSLSRANYDVFLIVADGKGDEVKEGISIHDVGAARGRLDRIHNITKRIFEKALTIEASIYHFHDPELIPIGLKLKRLGKNVIFDSHEDVPKQLLGKPYLNKPSRLILSRVIDIYERWACKQLDAVVAATPFIKKKFLEINRTVIDINNFPMWGELSSPIGWENKLNKVCYVGGISAIRGAREIVRAMEYVASATSLDLAGQFAEKEIEDEVRAYPGWSRINAHGFIDRSGVRDILASCVAGIVTFHPVPNHLDAQPNKMFEYMSAGVPVIASNFPLWREIIEGNDCGLCVDPLDPRSIAHAIDFLVRNPDQAARMGDNGRKAVQERYNWDAEEKKLLLLYKQLLTDK